MTSWDDATSDEILQDLRRAKEAALSKPYRIDPIIVYPYQVELLKQYCIDNHLQWDELAKQLNIQIAAQEEE